MHEKKKRRKREKRKKRANPSFISIRGSTRGGRERGVGYRPARNWKKEKGEK